MAYTKQTWIDEPNHTTPISAARLNHIEDGIETANTEATHSAAGQMSAEDKTKLDILNEPEISGETLII